MSSNIKQKNADKKENEEIHLLMHILLLKLYEGYDAKIAREEAKKNEVSMTDSNDNTILYFETRPNSLKEKLILTLIVLLNILILLLIVSSVLELIERLL